MFDKVLLKLSAVIYFLNQEYKLISDDLYQHRFVLNTFAFNDEKNINVEVESFKKYVYEKLGITSNEKRIILCEFSVSIYQHLIKRERCILGVNDILTNEEKKQRKINSLFKMMMF